MSDENIILPPIEDGTEKSARNFLYLGAALVVGFSIWASIGTLSVVSVAEGEVVPSSQVKSIQHLEGGIVRELSVREGQRVEKGQKLVVLESTASGADVNELRTRIAGLKVEITRLEAELSGAKEVKFDPEIEAGHPGLVREARQLLKNRRNRLSDTLTGGRANVSQRSQDVKEVEARIRNQQKTLKLLREKIEISESLLKDQLTNRYKHLDLLQEATRLEGAIEQDTVAVERTKSALAQSDADLSGLGSKFSEEASKAIDAARRQLAEFTPRLKKFEDSLKRTTLRAPVNGVIKTMHVVTVGGVVKPGDVVLDIVPAGDQLIVEARLSTQDIGFVRAGQDATVKLTATDAMRFGNLPGKVTNVSPDTLADENGKPFYRIRIETDRNHFLRGEMRYDLFPGMEVSTSIHTGARTVLEYLLDPFLNARGEAMRER
ncbi:MAG: HlyD family type I secretion periplasmic adaptor subunit [Rhodospirillales bacterium]|nr:HlyD family type I secretion periplasmic adaptor subunit [Rhodospirillales bacterium]